MIDRNDIVCIAIPILIEAIAVTLFIAMIAVWLIIGASAS